VAQSPTHKFGQIIGEVLEAAIREPLGRVARKHRLFLDFKHPRAARGGRRKVAWRDHKGNTHDLDYVLEEGGSDEKVGRPRAFIEIAWRRYTKHPRNKAQEIQGAIAPLAETYACDRPFLGVVLAGVFTQGAITQLASQGFGVLYFPYSAVTRAFRAVGIDAVFEESSSDAEVRKKVDAYGSLSESQKATIARVLRSVCRRDIHAFLARLETSLNRRIRLIVVLPLHGSPHTSRTAADAIGFIRSYDRSPAAPKFVRFELSIRYTNGDEILANFEARSDAIAFLQRVT